MENFKTLSTPHKPSCTLYKRRWIILFLYTFCGFVSTVQCFQYLIIPDVFVKFYGITYSNFNGWTTVFFLLYLVFFLPGMYILEKLGLRNSILIFIVGNLVSALLKIATAAPDRYWLFVISQTITSSLFVILQPIPPKLASVWFGPNEVSTACGICAIGGQIGEAVGMVYPAFIISSDESLPEIQQGLQTMSFIISGLASVGLILVFFLFQEQPATPPSPAQSKLELQSEPFLVIPSLKKLFRSSAYTLILATNGFVGGALNIFLVVLSQMVLFYCPGASKDAGIIGLITTMSGVIGSVAVGIVLDKYRNYKSAAVVPLAVSFLILVSLSFVATNRIVLIYVFFAILGFTLRAVVTMTYEAVAEVTYPEPLSLSVGILVCLPVGVAGSMVYLYSYLLYDVGHIYANLTLSAMILLGLVSIACVCFELKRNNAQVEMNS